MTPLSSPCSYRQEHIWSISVLPVTCMKSLSFYQISHFSFFIWKEKDFQNKKMHKDAFGVIQGEILRHTFWAALWTPGTSDVAYWVFRYVSWKCYGILWNTLGYHINTKVCEYSKQILKHHGIVISILKKLLWNILMIKYSTSHQQKVANHIEAFY